MLSRLGLRAFALPLALAAIMALAIAVPVGAAGFTHGLAVDVDGTDYYLAGAPDGRGGETDVPGHYWVQVGPDLLVGKHFNTEPFGAPQ
jgi:selenium-binding protein 1